MNANEQFLKCKCGAVRNSIPNEFTTEIALMANAWCDTCKKMTLHTITKPPSGKRS